jgi:hypothetical protein
LQRRWFAAGADYRQRLEKQLGAKTTAVVASLFEGQRGASLPQPMQHTLVRCRRSG